MVSYYVLAGVIGLVVLGSIFISYQSMNEYKTEKEVIYDLVLASALTGKLEMSDGSAAAEVAVTRTIKWHWNDTEFEQTTTTDQHGSFAFSPIVKRAWWASFIPHEPMIDQLVTAQYQGEPKKLLSVTKRDYERAGELFNRSFSQPRFAVKCTLDAPVRRSAELPFIGVCREWQE